MKIVPFKTANKDLHETCFPHLLFDGWICADIEEDVETDEE
jgi:hypothetical protein